MVVTLIELFAWVMNNVAPTATNKFLAFSVCLVVEKIWGLTQIH
jgi:hypothetical protein